MKQIILPVTKFFTAVIVLLLCSCNPADAQTEKSLPLKLRIGTYNVGHFNQGSPGGYQGTDAPKEMQRWRSWIEEQKMDIFFVQEWNLPFDKDSAINATDSLLKPFYRTLEFGERRDVWIYNGIATNRKLKNIRIAEMVHKMYYAIVADLQLGDKTVTVMSVHIPWQKGEHTAALDALLKELKKYEYVICCGDLNSTDKEQRRIAEAGFNLANGGESGWFVTVRESANKKGNEDDCHIDNIITSKNIKITNISAPMTGLNDKDHLPVLADIEIEFK
jgi:endonuclease/exonuclease/phosphatase family metal-dependent hydrolase